MVIQRRHTYNTMWSSLSVGIVQIESKLMTLHYVWDHLNSCKLLVLLTIRACIGSMKHIFRFISVNCISIITLSWICSLFQILWGSALGQYASSQDMGPCFNIRRPTRHDITKMDIKTLWSSCSRMAGQFEKVLASSSTSSVTHGCSFIDYSPYTSEEYQSVISRGFQVL